MEDYGLNKNSDNENYSFNDGSSIHTDGISENSAVDAGNAEKKSEEAIVETNAELVQGAPEAAVEPARKAPVENVYVPVNAGRGTGGGQEPSGFYQASQSPSYYTENFKKKKERKTNVFQLILVAVLSSILGGGVVFAAIQFVSPVIQPSLKGFLNQGGVTATDSTSGNNGTYKKVEITKTDSAVSAVYEKLSPSIVGIKETANSTDFFLGQGQSTGEGSGIIIREDGYILTNNHVIEGALSTKSNTLTQGAKIEVVLPSDTKKTYTATVVGRDTKSDLAVIKIDAGKKLPAAELGDSDRLKQGELAVAIGNPGGLDYMGSVTAGVISGLNRTLQTEDGQNLTLIQTDAAINPGNSGGALANSQGQVVGINTVKISATGYEGLGFAIPINHAKEIANSLIEYKYIKGRPLLGIQIRQEIDKATAAQYDVPEGVLVGDVTPLGAADRAGIQRNDIVTKFDGQAVNTYAKLEELKNKHKPGDKVQVEIYRYETKKTSTVTVTLDEDKS